MYGNISSGNKHLLFGLTLSIAILCMCEQGSDKAAECVGLSEPSLVAYVISTKIS